MPKILTRAAYALLLLAISSTCFSQTETFDIATFTPPKDFKKVTNQGVISYSQVNTTLGIFCVIAMYPSTTSTGDAQQDFNKDWKELVATPFGAVKAVSM